MNAGAASRLRTAAAYAVLPMLARFEQAEATNCTRRRGLGSSTRQARKELLHTSVLPTGGKAFAATSKSVAQCVQAQAHPRRAKLTSPWPAETRSFSSTYCRANSCCGRAVAMFSRATASRALLSGSSSVDSRMVSMVPRVEFGAVTPNTCTTRCN